MQCIGPFRLLQLLNFRSCKHLNSSDIKDIAQEKVCYLSLDTQSCIKRPFCSKLRFDNLKFSLSKEGYSSKTEQIFIAPLTDRLAQKVESRKYHQKPLIAELDILTGYVIYTYSNFEGFYNSFSRAEKALFGLLF